MSQKTKLTPKPSPKNTLFNYFKSNTPKTPKTEENASFVEPEIKIEKQKTLTGKQLDFGKKTELFNNDSLQ